MASPLVRGRLGGDGAGVRVVIVDSGVEVDHPWIRGRCVESYTVDGDCVRPLESSETCDRVGHGTACASRVLAVAPEADIVSLRVFQNGMDTTSEALVVALRWLRELPCHVVNLSLSTQRKERALEIGLAIDDLWERDIACICARGYHAHGKAFPTYFANTMGVNFGADELWKLEFHARSLVEFSAEGLQVPVAWCGGETRRVDGSSFAAPVVAGLAARILSKEPDLTPYALRSRLADYAVASARLRSAPWAKPKATRRR